VAPEPECSSPYTQEPATSPYPEPTGSTPHPQPISLRSILVPSSYLPLGFPSGIFPSGFPTKTLYTFLSPPMPRPPLSPWFDLPTDICGWVQNVKLLAVQLPSFSCYFVPLTSKYSPLVYAPLLMWESKSHTHTKQNNWLNYGFPYCNLYIRRQQAGS
jgi:hypothetical protein